LPGEQADSSIRGSGRNGGRRDGWLRHGVDEDGFRDCCASDDVVQDVDGDEAQGLSLGVERTRHSFPDDFALLGGRDVMPPKR
jgi:hypothetical protein